MKGNNLFRFVLGLILSPKGILFTLLMLISLNGFAAFVGFNKVYIGTNSSGNTFTFATGSSSVNIVPVSGINFYFTDHKSGSTFTAVSGNWPGFLEYYDSNGNLNSIAGSINKQDKTGSTTEAVHFAPSSGSTTYLLILPNWESKYSLWNTGNISSTGTVGMSANNPDLNVIAAANPQIYLSKYSLSNVTTCNNAASSYNTLSVSGANLSANITAALGESSKFEISTSASSGYASSLTLSKSGTSLSSTTIYVRLKTGQTAGSYSDNVTFSSTNASSQSVYVTGDVYATTAVATSPSSANVCSGSSTSFTVSATGANLTYQWQVSPDSTNYSNISTGGIYLGASSSTLFLSSSLTSAYSRYRYRCVVTGSCSSATSSAATLNVKSLPSVTSNPSNSTVCAGTGTSFSVIATGTVITYQWQYSTDGTNFNDLTNTGIYSGATTSTLSLSSSLNASYNNYYYRCVISGSCSPSATSSAAQLTVNSTPSTPGSISGYSSICSNTNQYYSITSVSGATSYSWTLPSGWTGSSSSNNINLTNNTSSGTLSVTATNSCGTSSAANLAITVSNVPAPTPSFSVDYATQCLSGNSFNFTDVSTPASGTSITALNWDFGDTYTSTSSSAAHTYASSGTYNVLLKVTASNSCISSLSKAVIVNPAPSATLTGTATICSGSSSNLTVTLTGTAPWTLVYSGSANPIVINSSPYTISVTPSATTTYSITSLSDANCTAAAGNLSGTPTVTVSSNNTALVSLSSSDTDNSICSGNSVTFTATPTNGGASPTYQWLLNGTSFSNSGNTYTTTGLVDNDQISVIMTSNLSGCLVGSPAQSNIIATEVNPAAPSTPATITGTQAQCAGLSNQVYSISDVLNASSYTWSVPTGWTISSGQNSNSIYVTTGSNGQNGDILVSAKNGCGTSNSQILAVTSVSTTNTLSLSSASGTNNQTKCVSSAITNITYSTTGSPTGATVTGLPAGVSGSFSSNVVTISGTPTEAGTFNYTITLTGGSCNANITGTITVTANNTITLSSSAGSDGQTVCNNTSISNITYSTTGATNASFSGLPTGILGAFSSNVVTISGTPTASGTFSYTITLTGGCGSVTKTGTITVTAANTATLSSAAGTNNQTKCVSSAITNITYSTTGATSISSTGLPSGVTASFSSNTITISGTPTASGTFNYTISLIGGCGAVTASGTITVNPTVLTPVITTSPTTTICSGNSTTLTSSSAGTGTYLWNTGATTQSISATTAGTYTITVTNAGGCSATSAGTTITVLSNSVTASISGTTSDYDIVSLTASGGTTYTWDAGNSPTSASNTFIESGTYYVTVEDANGCSATESVEVTIKLRGLSKYGELVGTKNTQINKNGKPNTDNPLLSTGQIKSYPYHTFVNLDARDASSYSGTGTEWTNLTNSSISGTLVNGPSFQNSSIKSFQFDGTNDYVSFPSGFGTANSFTIESWVNLESNSSYRVISNMNGWAAGYIHFQFYNGSLLFEVNGSTPVASKSFTYSFSLNTWYHVVVAYDNTAKKLYYYVNGDLTDTITYTTPVAIPNIAFKIGSWEGTARFFQGQIGTFRYSNSALTAKQIKKIFTANKSSFGVN